MNLRKRLLTILALMLALITTGYAGGPATFKMRFLGDPSLATETGAHLAKAMADALTRQNCQVTDLQVVNLKLPEPTFELAMNLGRGEVRLSTIETALATMKCMLPRNRIMLFGSVRVYLRPDSHYNLEAIQKELSSNLSGQVHVIRPKDADPHLILIGEGGRVRRSGTEGRGSGLLNLETLENLLRKHGTGVKDLAWGLLDDEYQFWYCRAPFGIDLLPVKTETKTTP